MIQPVDTAGGLITSFSTALVIACGALYLLLFSIACLRAKPGLLILAYACFAVLAANVLVLATLLHLDLYTLAKALAALLACLLVPHAVRQLAAGAHGKTGGHPACCPAAPAERS